MKIVYVIDSLASKGGAERILCDKMNYEAMRFGYDVSVVTCYQNVAKDANAYVLSDNVTQINLNIPYYSQYYTRYPMRLWVKWRLYRRLKTKLTETVKLIDPDILVGLGYFNADMVSGIKCRAKKIVESHEARLFTMSDSGLSRSMLSRLFMRYYKQRYFRWVEQQADVVVTLTAGDRHEWRKARRVEVIPNFTVMPVNKISDIKTKRVIAVGRLEWQKGFDRLLDAWKLLEMKHLDWRLDIYGSGTMDQSLRHQITSCGLNNVTINPFTPNIAEEYARSSIFALSSRFEGFGLVLLEAMQAGLPCVAFDCPYGPSDVVADGVTGILVSEGDIDGLAVGLEKLMQDEELRERYSKASLERISLFNVDAVMSQWERLFLTL